MGKKTGEALPGPSALRESPGTPRKTNERGRVRKARTTAAAARLGERRAAARPARPPAAAAGPRQANTGTVTWQARIDAGFARELVEADAPVLGLDSASALVREGLRLVHKQARELAMAKEYDEYYGGEPAPLPEGVAAAWDD